jgi:hypothetical protein
LDYCVPLGIPHSTFLGWLEEDQDKAIAWQRSKLGRCQECGTPIHEWVDASGEAVEPPPYVVTTAYCVGCATVKEERDRIKASGSDDRADTVKVYLVKNPDKDDLLKSLTDEADV